MSNKKRSQLYGRRVACPKRDSQNIACPRELLLQHSEKSRTLRRAEHLAAQRFIKLRTRHTGGLAMRQAGQRRGDGRREAAGGAGGRQIMARD